MNPLSIEMSPDEESQKFLQKSALWENTERLETFKGRANEFAAIFFVGGGGRTLSINLKVAQTH